MRKKISISVAIGLILIAIGLVVFWPRDEGPLYDGKPVSYWLAHPKTNLVGFTAGISGRSGTYVLNFPKFDSNAVPYIIKALEAKDGPAKAFYVHVWEKSPTGISRWLPEPIRAQSIKLYALAALDQMGPEAKPAIPALLQIIKEDDGTFVTFAAVMTLEHFDPRDKDVRDALITASTSTNSAVGQFARDALVRQQTDGPF